MRGIVVDRPGSFRVAEVPDPTPRAGEIIVKVDCCRPLLGEPLPLEGFGAAVDHVRAGEGIKWHIRPS